MGKKERFQTAYSYLYEHGAVHSITELAEKMNRERPGVSNAYNGKAGYLNDKFLTAFCSTFPGIFSLDWLITGAGEMLLSNTKNSEEADMPDIYERFDILKEINNAHKETIEALKSQMADLRMQLVDKQNVIDAKDLTIKAQERTIELLNLQITGLKTEMRMKGVASYPFEMGVSEKLSAPDK